MAAVTVVLLLAAAPDLTKVGEATCDFGAERSQNDKISHPIDAPETLFA